MALDRKGRFAHEDGRPIIHLHREDETLCLRKVVLVETSRDLAEVTCTVCLKRHDRLKRFGFVAVGR